LEISTIRLFRWGSHQTRTPGLACNRPVPSTASAPIPAEPQEIKGRQSLTQHRHHTLCVVLPFKTEATIIRIPHQDGFASQTRFDLFGEPQIEHVVQINVA